MWSPFSRLGIFFVGFILFYIASAQNMNGLKQELETVKGEVESLRRQVDDLKTKLQMKSHELEHIQQAYDEKANRMFQSLVRFSALQFCIFVL